MTHRKIHALCWQCGNSRDVIVLAAKKYRVAACRIVLSYRDDIRKARHDTFDDPLTDADGAGSNSGSHVVDALVRDLTAAEQATVAARITTKEACIAADQAHEGVDEAERALIITEIARGKASARLEQAKAELM